MKLSKRQQLLYDQVKLWHKGQKRKGGQDYFTFHIVRTAELAVKFKLPYGWEVMMLHDTLEDVKLFKYYQNPEFAKKTLGAVLHTFGYTPQEEQFIMKKVVALTDYYCTAYFPGLNRYQRKLMETKRLLELPGRIQDYKLCDIICNVQDTQDITSESFKSIYLNEKKQYIKMLSTGVDLGYVNKQIINLAAKEIKNAKKIQKEKNGKKANG